MRSKTLAFSLSNLGPKKFQTLLSFYGDSSRAWDGSKGEYLNLGIGEKTFVKFQTFKNNFSDDSFIKKLERANVFFIPFEDPQYPARLKELENPPIGIFCKGNIALLMHGFLFAVVGTRKATSYGKSVTETIVSDLSHSGACIVSGLALGIDAISHRAALENNAPTVAVLACGVDCCLPSENYSLYSQILKNDGLIVSEYPLSQPPNKGTFLARNRIVAALSQGVLVTEAAEDSGSLVTAEWGLTLSKKVFAVPGPINSPMMQGSLKLLKHGAKLVTNGNDIVEELGIKKKVLRDRGKEKLKNLSGEESQIVSLLENEDMTVDELSKALNLPVPKLFVVISGLELKGIIKNISGKIFRRYE